MKKDLFSFAAFLVSALTAATFCSCDKDAENSLDDEGVYLEVDPGQTPYMPTFGDEPSKQETPDGCIYLVGSETPYMPMFDSIPESKKFVMPVPDTLDHVIVLFNK